MKRITTVICMALLWILTVQAQIQELNVSKRFNWGIRLGVNAPLVDIRHLILEREQSQRIRFRIEAGIIRLFYRKIQFQEELHTTRSGHASVPYPAI